MKIIIKPDVKGSGRENNRSFVLTARETVLCMISGYAAFFTAVFIMFLSPIAAFVCGFAGAAVGIPAGRRIIFRRRMKMNLIQFRDFLESLSNAFSSGNNMKQALKETYATLCLSYGPQTMIIAELGKLIDGLNNGITAEALLDAWQERSGLRCVSDFADTMNVSLRSGGDLKAACADCRDILNGKIDTEMEIMASVASGRSELNVLSAMPFAVTLVLRLMGSGELSDNTPLNVAVKIGALALFAAAYIIGLKITDIRV